MVNTYQEETFDLTMEYNRNVHVDTKKCYIFYRKEGCLF